MRKLNYTYYVCEFCGSKYETEEEARKCEEFHKKPIKLIEAGFIYYPSYNNDYIPDDINCYGFPDKIEVEDDSGNRACYKYDYYGKGE